MNEHRAEMSLTEWQNLLAAVQTDVDRYEIEAVKEAIEYLYKRGGHR